MHWQRCSTFGIYWEFCVFLVPIPISIAVFLRKLYFVSFSKEARKHRHPSAVHAHRETESTRVHRQAEHHPDYLKAVHAACHLGTRIGFLREPRQPTALRSIQPSSSAPAAAYPVRDTSSRADPPPSAAFLRTRSQQIARQSHWLLPGKILSAANGDTAAAQCRGKPAFHCCLFSFRAVRLLGPP